MRRRNVFSILSLMTLMTMTAGMTGSVITHAEEYRGTLQQQLACTPDVYRLCISEIPDTDRIVVCLRQNMQQLSNGCRAVFDANASVQNEPPQSPAQTPA